MTAEAAQLARPSSLPLRLAAWCSGPAAIAAAHFATLELHPIARMWVFVGLLFFWMKAVVLAEHHTAGKPLPPTGRLFAWLLLWPGMRPGGLAKRTWSEDWVSPLRNGFAAVIGACFVMFAGLLTAGFLLTPHAIIPFVMVAFSLALHYGLFSLLTAGWRMARFNVGPLFRNPFASRSLADFWGRRWNLAFVEMCQETVVRALRNPTNRQSAKAPNPGPLAFWRFGGKSQLAVFLFSGLLHEVAISLPVNAGYGLPMLYFVLNGGAMLVGRKLREGSVASRAWAAFWVIAPLPLLFHPWFLQGVMLPMVGANS